jgi:hypothetical protein
MHLLRSNAAVGTRSLTPARLQQGVLPEVVDVMTSRSKDGSGAPAKVDEFGKWKQQCQEEHLAQKKMRIQDRQGHGAKEALSEPLEIPRPEQLEIPTEIPSRKGRAMKELPAMLPREPDQDDLSWLGNPEDDYPEEKEMTVEEKRHWSWGWKYEKIEYVQGGFGYFLAPPCVGPGGAPSTPLPKQTSGGRRCDPTASPPIDATAGETSGFEESASASSGGQTSGGGVKVTGLSPEDGRQDIPRRSEGG